MKTKKRRGTEAPPKVRAFISSVLLVPFENIDVPLKSFVWEYDKGDFNHWIDLFNHFDLFFENFVKPRKDLQLDINSLEQDTLFPKSAVLEVLRVSRIILENCANKHLYSSYEHISTLLASPDTEIVIGSLSTLAAFVKKPMGKCSIREASLNAKLFALSQGWGGKEEGLGLLACSTANGPDPVAWQLGSTLHFEFYADEAVHQDSSGDKPKALGLQVIHIPDLCKHPESDLQLLKILSSEYKIPQGLRFSFFTRLRFARAFSVVETRRQYVCIRLLAFTVLVQASNEANDLAAFFNNEPEYVNELVALVRFDESVPEEIHILAILALAALYQDRPRQTSVLNALTSGGNRGILPSMMQKAVRSVSSNTGSSSISFLEALLSLVTVLVSSSSGCTALRDVGLMPTLLPLLKDLDPLHIHLVTAAVHVLEAFMDYSNPSAPSFRDLGGLENTIDRLKVEVSQVEERVTLTESENPVSEVLVPYNRRLLMKALLRAISLGTYSPGNTRLYGSEESALPFCLCTIFRRTKAFGGGVFSLAVTVMSDLIHRDPTCYPILDAAGLPNAFLDAIMSGVLPSSDAVACIPACLDALCLNNLGLEAITGRGALRCFVKIFTSKTYLRALSGDTAGSLSTALDELMRHTQSLRGPGVDMLIEILTTISSIGSSCEVSSKQESVKSSMAEPMETDTLEKEVKEQSVDDSIGVAPDQNCESTAVEQSANNNIESFLPECISNVTHLLEHLLHNSETCGMFIEKKGIESVLQLIDIPMLPLSVASCQNIAVAFKNFSPQHSQPLTRAVCKALRDHLKPAVDLMSLLEGKKLSDIEGPQKKRVLKGLSSLEGVLSFSTHLLKSTATMMPELGSGDAEILKELGSVYKEILWQISLVNESTVEPKQDLDQASSAGSQPSSSSTEATIENNGGVSVMRYTNPVSTRNIPASHWSVEPEYVSVFQTGLSRHSRREFGVDGLSRIRLSRLGRHAEPMDGEIAGSINAAETGQSHDAKRRSPNLECEVLNKLASAMRAFYVSLVKVLVVPSRRRDDPGSLSAAAKSVLFSLSKVFLESLSIDDNQGSSGFDSLLSTKCRFLGKVVDDMAAVVYDSRKRTCNVAVVNSFYAQGTIRNLLTTFEATGQLLWTRSFMSQNDMETDTNGKNGNEKLEHSPWLLETMRSYCRLLEYLVNSSSLLSMPSASPLLVQQNSGATITVPKDPENFVRSLQSQVLYAILPIWNNPLFPSCNGTLITTVVSIINHIYSGINGSKGNRSGSSGNSAQRSRGYLPDENTISMLVDMGFPRGRAEEALRHVESNSVELAMEWIFSHPEEPAQEDDELAQALALSLGGSETAKDSCNEKENELSSEEKLIENPPIEDILSTCMKLLQGNDTIAFQVTDLIVTLCSQNKGQYRPRVVSYLVEQLKSCKIDESNTETSLLSTISHLLALVLSEDSSAREICADSGLVGVALDLLSKYTPVDTKGDKTVVPKWVAALLLCLDHMLQCKLQQSTDTQNLAGTGEGSFATVPENTNAELTEDIQKSQKMALKDSNEEENPFVRILGKPAGYMTLEEQEKAMSIICELLRHPLPASLGQAVLQLCARLTKLHSMAMQFLETDGVSLLLNLPRSSFFPGFDSVAAVIIRHLLEDPHTLQMAMEVEIRQTLQFLRDPRGTRTSPRAFLTALAPVIARDPAIFMQAASSVCQLQTVGGRPDIILNKEKEDKAKDKERTKEKDREKIKISVSNDTALGSGDNIKTQDGVHKQPDQLGKSTKNHKKIPHSFSQVIDQLLELVLQYSPPIHDELNDSVAMEIEEALSKSKGKGKIDELGKGEDERVSDKFAGMAKVAFILKLLCDILLMYTHAISVVLKRDSESSQGRGSCHISDTSGHGGLLNHVLHRLLPCFVDKKSDINGEEWKERLSEKACLFLVVISGRSAEGRRRVITEVVKALDNPSNGSGSCKQSLRNKKLLAFVDLVNSILSGNSTSANPQVPGCSPDIAKTMIEAGMVQTLTNSLQAIDLDHPEAPKMVNHILKALEALTRAASISEQISKPEDIEKKIDSAQEVAPNLTGMFSLVEENNNRNETDSILEQGTTLGERQQEINHDALELAQNESTSLNGNSDHEMQTDRNEAIEVHNAEEGDGHIISATIEVNSDLHAASGSEMAFRVERRTDDDMGEEEEEEDMDDEAEEEDEDDEEDDEDDIEGEEGAAHMSLADTDIEDHEDNGLGDDYNDDMVEDDDEDDFSGSRVIEVRWREGLDGLNHVQVLGHAGGDANLVDLSSEPFHVNMDDIFGLRRPVVDRRRPSSQRTVSERPSSERSSSYQHPLLTRPIQNSAGISQGSWSVGGRDAATLSGRFAHYLMYDAPLFSSENSGGGLLGDRGVGAPPPLLDFSTDPSFLTGRRGGPLHNGRWTDDGQPQVGAQATTIAQAIEEEFLSQLRCLNHVDQPSNQSAVNPNSENQNESQHNTTEAMDTAVQTDLRENDVRAHIPEQQTNETEQLQQQSDVVLGENPNDTVLLQTASANDRDGPDVIMRDEEDDAVNREIESGSQYSDGSGATMGESLRSLEVETGSIDGHNEENDRQVGSITIGAPTVAASAGGMNTNTENVSTYNIGMDLANNVAETVSGNSPALEGAAELPVQSNDGVNVASNQEGGQGDNEEARANTIDPTFLEALPEDLRAEVLASQQVQSSRPANYAPPPTEDIDPEFLAALPPEIQAEVLAQQRAQRVAQSQQSEGQPVDMDSASIIATFPVELREEVLLTSSEAVLAALSPALLAEAQMLRERAMNQYQARSLFGSTRLGSRRHNLTSGQSGGGGLTTARRQGTALTSSMKMKEVEGKALVDKGALKALLKLLRLAQPLGKGLLQRLLFNLCAHSATRSTLVHLLLDMLRPEADGMQLDTNSTLHQRLFGCQWNVVYARSQLNDGVPPLVTRRVLEILTYLAKNHTGVADLLFYKEAIESLDSSSHLSESSKGEKGKGIMIEEPLKEFQTSEIPLILFLKLLNKPLFSRSSAHLEQVMGLLEVIVNKSGLENEMEAAKINKDSLDKESGENGNSAQVENQSNETSTGASLSTDKVQDDPSSQRNGESSKKDESTEPSTSGAKKKICASDILLQLPKEELRNLCKLLAKEGLSDTVYTKLAEVLKKLAGFAPSHRKLFVGELAESACILSIPAVEELVTLGEEGSLGLSAGSIAGTTILRVLQALSSLTSEVDKDTESYGLLINLNVSLDLLWQGLSSCISKIEHQLGNTNENFGSSTRNSIAVSVSSPLPPGTQRVLPFIEAFLVLCEKLQGCSGLVQNDVDDATSSEASQYRRTDGGMSFVKFAEKHRRLLNAFVRQQHGLLDKSFSLLLKTPRLIDFDNKRTFFRSRIKQQNEQHNYNPLRICVRRTYVLEDSYSQLRLRSIEEMKGRLTVQFQGEEGIDAGGLTREWYQLLSRVIFDKGALLFTTVGNQSTFQPNPNSVYQTEHLSYFKFVGRVVAKALFDGQLLDVYFTRSFYKHILGAKVTYHDIEAVDPDYYKNLKWMLENDVNDILDLTFSIDADEEKHILYEKTEVTDHELIPGGGNIRVTDENKHKYVDLVAEHRLTTAIRPQISHFLEGFSELIPTNLISIFNDKELELLISGLPEIDFDDLKSSTEYTGYTAASPVIQWFWEVVKGFSKEDMARLLQFVTGTSKVPLEGFKALQGISGPQRFQIHKAYGAPERLPTAHTCFNQLDLPEYSSKEQLQERLLLAIHEASEGFGFG